MTFAGSGFSRIDRHDRAVGGATRSNMLAIRMRRVGSKKRPFFRIVVARAEAARDGSFIEVLGHYYPRTRPAMIDVDRERMQYWLSKGAKASDTVRTLFARHLPPAPPSQAGAASEPAPAAATE
jgi:small subunit ribosomal protein S16